MDETEHQRVAPTGAEAPPREALFAHAAVLASWVRPPEHAETDPPPEHVTLLRRMAQDLDRFHRAGAAPRRAWPQPAAGIDTPAGPLPGAAPGPAEFAADPRLAALARRVALLERAAAGGETTVAADALAPLRTLLDVLSGEVTRLRKVSPLRLPDDDAATQPAPVAVVAPVVAPVAAPDPPPAAAVAPRRAPDPPRRPSRHSAAILAAVLALPVLVLGAVFLDRVPVPRPVAHLAAPNPRPLVAYGLARADVLAPPRAAPAVSAAPSIHAAAPAVRVPAVKPVVTKPAVIALMPKSMAGPEPDTAAAAVIKLAVIAPTPKPIVATPAAAKPPVRPEPVTAAAAVIKPAVSAPTTKPTVAAQAAAQPSIGPEPVRTAPAVIGPQGTTAPAGTLHGDLAMQATPLVARATAPAPAAPPKIAIRATADAWVSLLDGHGTVVLSRLLHAGDTLVPPAPGLLLTTGNAGGTELVVNGFAGPPLGATGVVRHGVPLVAQAAR